MDYYDLFINAIHDKKIIKVIEDTDEKGRIERTAIPYDFGKSKRGNLTENPDKYHMHHIETSHTVSILPSKIVSMELTGESFDPADYVTWETNWNIPRDWGDKS